MVKKEFLLFSMFLLILFIPQVQAQTGISDCTNLNTAGETYSLTASISDSSTSYCMNISANNITLDCQNYMIDGDDIAINGIWVRRPSQITTNITIQNCKISDWNYNGIRFQNANNNTFKNLNVSDNSDSNADGIYLLNSDSNTIFNIISNLNGWSGIHLAGADFNTINNITANSNKYPIFLDDCNSNIITNITAKSNKDFFTTDTINDNLFENIYIYADVYPNFGFRLGWDGASHNNTFNNLTIIGNMSGLGMHFGWTGYNATGNVLANSSIYNFSIGINFYYGGSDTNPNKFYNNFFNNTDNFNVPSSPVNKNIWNTTKQTGTRIFSDGTEIGGNFYTNITAPGYSITCTDADGDGFCDTAYTILNANNIDYLPYSDEYDNLPPTIEFITPTTANGTTQSSTTIYINTTVVDAINNIATCILTWKQDTNVATNYSMTKYNNTAGDGKNLTCNYTFTGLSDARYTYKVLANDTLGNFNLTNVREVTVDATNPSIFFTTNTPTNNTNSTSNSILMNVTITDVNPANLTYVLVNSTAEINRTFVTITSSGNYSLNFTSLTDDTYRFNVTATDKAGNKNFTETRTLLIDTTYPLINFTIDTANNGTYWNKDYVVVNVTITETNFANFTFILYNSTTEINRTFITDKTATRLNFTSLSDDVYQYNVTITDTVGNKNFTETRTITLDNIAPYVNIIFPTNATTHNIYNVTLNFTATDTNINSCRYGLNGVNTTITCSQNATFGILLKGNNNLTLYANDSANNKNSTLTYTIFGDSTPPALNISLRPPVAGELAVLVYMTSTDNIEISNCWYRVLINNVTEEKGNTTISDCQTFTANVGLYGSYTVRVYSNDTSSNQNITSASFTTSAPELGGGGGGAGGPPPPPVEYVMAVALLKHHNDPQEYTDLQRAILYARILNFTVEKGLDLTDEEIVEFLGILGKDDIRIGATQVKLWLIQYKAGAIEEISFTKTTAEKYGLTISRIIIEEIELEFTPDRFDTITFIGDCIGLGKTKIKEIRTNKNLKSCEIIDGAPNWQCNLSDASAFFFTFRPISDAFVFRVFESIARIETQEEEVAYFDKARYRVINICTSIPISGGRIGRARGILNFFFETTEEGYLIGIRIMPLMIIVLIGGYFIFRKGGREKIAVWYSSISRRLRRQS